MEYFIALLVVIMLYIIWCQNEDEKKWDGSDIQGVKYNKKMTMPKAVKKKTRKKTAKAKTVKKKTTTKRKTKKK